MKLASLLVALLAAHTATAALPSHAQPGVSAAQPNQLAPTKPIPAVWLVLRFGSPNGAALTVLPTGSMDQCEMAGAEYTASKRLFPSGDSRGFECLDGIR
jgi:hypothetical protein